MKRLIYFLLSLLGVSMTGCDIGAVEYGAPYVNFNLKARVVDEAGNPIQGIEVRTERGAGFDDKTGVSDYMGNIDAHSGNVWSGSRGEYVMMFQDIDGELNGGKFETLTLDITDKVRQTEPGEGWYSGAFVANVGDVVMSLQQEADDEVDNEANGDANGEEE